MHCTAAKSRAPERRPQIVRWVGLPLALLLSGCFGNEPDEDDILAAVRQSRVQKQALMLDYPGVNFNNMASVDSAAERALSGAKVEKLGCTTPPNMPGLLCEFRIGLNTGGQLRYQKLMQRFLKVNGAWQIPG